MGFMVIFPWLSGWKPHNCLASHVRVTLASTSGPWIQTWWMLLGAKHGRLDDWKGIRLLRMGRSWEYLLGYMMIYVYCNIIYIIQWFWEAFYLFDDIPWYTHLYNPELIWLVSHSESGFSKSWGYPQIIPMSSNHCNIFQQPWWRKTLETSINF